MKLGFFASFGIGGADAATERLARAVFALKPDWEIKVFYNQFSIPKAVPGFHDSEYVPLSRFENYLPFCKPIEITSVAQLNNFKLDILQVFRSGEDHWLLPDFEVTKFNFKIVENNFHGVEKTKADIRVYPSYTLAGSRRPVIGNPVDPPTTNESLREELGINGKFVFGRIGREEHISLTPLEAYLKIRDSNTAFVYVAPNQNVRDFVAQHTLTDVLFLSPTIDNLRVSKLYNTFDVLCHGNQIGETFGNTIVEAMFHHVPVVSHLGNASDWPQAQVELLDPFSELVVPYGDTNKYADIMRMYMNDKFFYTHVKMWFLEKGPSISLSQLVAKEYIKLYESCMDRK